MVSFCTYFDRNYLGRALAMWESLTAVSRGRQIRLFALCLDEIAYEMICRLDVPGIIPVSLQDVEQYYPELSVAKANRSKIEYYFTLTPHLVSFLLESQPSLESLTYLDSDLYFFSDWMPLFSEMGADSVLIIPHRFPERLREREVNGRFNVGWITFKKDDTGRACAAWWRVRCWEWCYDRHEGGRFADQKYLDVWPELFPSVCISENIGANVAPWNVENYFVTADRNGVKVDGLLLIFYHFQGYRWVSQWLLDPGLCVYERLCPKVFANKVLRVYAKAVVRLSKKLTREFGDKIIGTGDTRRTDRPAYRSHYALRMIIEGRVMLVVGEWIGYLQSNALRRLCSGWDSIRGRS